MKSINQDVNNLHDAFCAVSGQDLPMLPFFERNWLEAHNYGVTPDDVTRVFKERARGVQRGERRRASLFLRAFCGSDEQIASVVEESAAIKARARVRVVDPNRASALKATGRPEFYTKREDAQAPEETAPAKQMVDIDLVNRLRKAAE